MIARFSEAALACIRVHEGLRLEAYRCPAGIWTIGYGHTRGVKSGDKITVEQAERYLLLDASEAELSVNRLAAVPLMQNQLDALVSFVFNLGFNKVADATLFKKLNANDYKGAAKEFDRWVYSSGKQLNGLVLRRADERKMFEGE